MRLVDVARLKRRHLILAGGAQILLLTATGAVGQKSARQYRIVVLLSVPQAYDAPYRAALKESLAAQGFVEGTNLRIDAATGSQGFDFDRQRIASLLARPPDAIFATTAGLSHAALAESSSAPVVFTWVADPVGSGLVNDYARPGGRATGVSSRFHEVALKRLQLLRELLPAAKRVVLAGQMYLPEVASAAAQLREVSGKLGFALQDANTGASAEVSAIEDQIRIGGQALLPLKVYSAVGQSISGEQVVALMLRLRIPAIFAESELVAAGGLMSYGTNLLDEIRQAAGMLAQVLRGGKPTGIPVSQASRFELAVNLKTARAIGVRVPSSILLRADRVIE